MKINAKKFSKTFYKKYESIFKQRPKTNFQVTSLKQVYMADPYPKETIEYDNDLDLVKADP